MFGPHIYIEAANSATNGEFRTEFGLILRPPNKEDIPEMVRIFGSRQVRQYTPGRFPITAKQEEDWLERAEHETKNVVWAIEPDLKEQKGKLIGITSIANIATMSRNGTSGITIAKEWWQKGIASTTHLARIWWAITDANLATISSSVLQPNIGSKRALEKVGYFVIGRQRAVEFTQGKYLDRYSLVWMNPTMITLLRPNGLEADEVMPLAQAEHAYEISKKLVKFI